MIVQKPADLDPAMKSALKNHIMRKRQQLKQELEQDAIEKRLKREQEAKRKQDAMTLDQLKDQLCQLERTLDNLKNEKHSLFAQLKQNMRVLNEDDTRRKQKEGEMNAARQQQQQQQDQQQQIHQQQQDSERSRQQQPLQHQPQQPNINGALPSSNQENHVPQPQTVPAQAKVTPRDSPFDMYSIPLSAIPQVPNTYHDSNQSNLRHEPPQDSNAICTQLAAAVAASNQNHINNTIANGGIPGNSSSMSNNLLINSSRNNPLPPQKRPISATNLAYDSMSPNKKIHTQQQPPQPPQQQSQQQQTQQHPPPPPQPQNPSHQLPTSLSSCYLSYPGLPTGLGSANGSSLPASLFSQNLMRTPPPPNMSSLLNSAAFSHLLNTHNFQRQSPYLTHLGPQPNHRSSNPYGPMSPYPPPIGHHPPPSLISGHGGNGNNNSVSNNIPINSSRNNSLPPTMRPISATNLANDSMSPNKKIHTQQQQQQQQQPPPPPQPQNPSHQLPTSLPNPYMSYPGLPPSLSSANGPGGLPASLFSQNLMRTPPPPNMSSLLNSAAFSHLLNTHNFPHQSPYLTHLGPQPNHRTSNPYGPMSPYPPPLGHHQPPSLISGHGIPTSLAHVPQNNPMIRPSPPPSMSNSSQMNQGPPKLSMNLPITSSQGPPSLPMDFNPNLVTSTAHQMQQQAAAARAAAAALAVSGYGSPYFNSNSPIGPPPSQF